jgi:hypothetical protein
VHARASSLLCLASFPPSIRTAVRLIEPPSTARHSGPPRATGWMTGASSQAGTRSANRRPTPRAPRRPPRSPRPDSPARVKRPRPVRITPDRNARRLTHAGSPGSQATNPGQSPKTPYNQSDPCPTATNPPFRKSKTSSRDLTSPGPSWMTQDVHGSDSRADCVVVTVGGHRTVRSPQPAAADTRPRIAAPRFPNGRKGGVSREPRRAAPKSSAFRPLRKPRGQSARCSLPHESTSAPLARRHKSGDRQAPSGCTVGARRRTRVHAEAELQPIGNDGWSADDTPRLEIGDEQGLAAGRAPDVVSN